MRTRKSSKGLERIKRMYAVNYSEVLLPSKAVRVVDLGCGNGEALEWLTDLGYRNLYGVDADPVKLQRVRQRLEGLVPVENIVQGDILEFVGASGLREGYAIMCPHNDFEIIYYKDGIMLRRCKDCQQVEMHLEWIWAGVDEVKSALDFLQREDYGDR